MSSSTEISSTSSENENFNSSSSILSSHSSSNDDNNNNSINVTYEENISNNKPSALPIKKFSRSTYVICFLFCLTIFLFIMLCLVISLYLQTRFGSSSDIFSFLTTSSNDDNNKEYSFLYQCDDAEALHGTLVANEHEMNEMFGKEFSSSSDDNGVDNNVEVISDEESTCSVAISNSDLADRPMLRWTCRLICVTYGDSDLTDEYHRTEDFEIYGVSLWSAKAKANAVGEQLCTEFDMVWDELCEKDEER